MERRRGPVVDGMSRILSTLAILLGIGGGLFLYQENQTLKEEVAKLQGTDYAGVASKVQADAAKFNLEWGNQLQGSLDAFGTQAANEIKRIQQSEELKEIVSQLERDRMDLQQAEDGLRALQDLQAFVYAPKLRVARTSGMFAGIDPNFVKINNEGLIPAEIAAVSFHPQQNGQFKTTEDEVRAATDRLTDNQSVVIEFTNDHNRSEKREQGLHRHYERAYQEGEKQFPGNKTVPLSVLIYNSDHRGWGWKGAMEIVYANGRSLFVPGVRAVFVPTDPLEEV